MDWLHSIYSDGTGDFISPEVPQKGQEVTIKLRLYRENPACKIYLRCAPEGEEELKEMYVQKEGQHFIWYHVKVRIFNSTFLYRFQISTPNKTYWYNNFGVHTTIPLDVHDFRIMTNFCSPSWLHKRVFYQIFPDRFACSNALPISDYTYLNHKPIRKKWHEKPGEYHHTHCMDFFGGNVEGVKKKTDYLQQLGINAIYLNPVFQAPTNHRYDVQDYYKIDPIFGDNSSFADLVEHLHQVNIKVILDGVFNHSGMACRWFNKANYYNENGAYQSLDSEYASYYCFKEHPHHYHSWQGVDTLPKFDYTCQKLRDAIYRGVDSVMQYWLKEPYKIDGWRIDAANMLGRSPGCEDYLAIWQELRSVIKQRYPDCYLLGEHFFDPSDLLQGNALDAAMNYQGFTFPVRKWITKDYNSEQLDLQLRTFRSTLSWPFVLNQYNLLNSHDIPRLSHIEPKQNLRKVAAAFLFTYPGIPALYYGEEVDLGGEMSCESSRWPMPWEEDLWSREMLSLYRSLIALRKDSVILQKGGFKALYVEDDVYCYARFLNEQVVIIILNRGDGCEVKIDLKQINVTAHSKIRVWQSEKLLSCGQDHCLHTHIEKHSFMIAFCEENF